VQPRALDGDVASEPELRAEGAERSTARIPAGSGDVLSSARSIRDALFAYRDGAELVLSTYALRLGSSHAQVALEASLGPASTERATAILHFILGHTTLAQLRMHAESHGAAASGDEIDPTAGLDTVFDLGVAAIAGIRASRPRDRA
jgi:hypothetical protein